MSCEGRTHKPLRPTARVALEKVGMFASLALVMAATVSPAAAASGSRTDHAAPSCGGGSGQRQLSSRDNGHDKDCRRDRGPKGDKGDPGPKGDKGDKGDQGPKGDRGAPGPCSDIDTYSRTDTQTGTPITLNYQAALSADGHFYGGILAYGTPMYPDREYLWTDLSTHSGYPAGGAVGLPCGAAVSPRPTENDPFADTVDFETITTMGRVYQISCLVEFQGAIPLPKLECGDNTINAWVEVNRRPDPNAVNGGIVLTP